MRIDDLPKPQTTDVIRKGSLSEYAASDDKKEEERRWRMFRIGEQDQRVDMKAIEPYKKVIRLGGEDLEGSAAFTLNLQSVLRKKNAIMSLLSS